MKLPLSLFFRLADPFLDLTIFDSGSFLRIEHPDVGGVSTLHVRLRFHTSHLSHPDALVGEAGRRAAPDKPIDTRHHTCQELVRFLPGTPLLYFL